MKAVKLSLAAVIIALVSFTAFAFIPQNEETKAEVTLLHWFEDGTNVYLGLDTQPNIQNNHCGLKGSQPCANGFTSITGSPGSEMPVGAPVDNATKQ